MIPKIIHYIWLGGNPLPAITEKCIESWRIYCPDYEIIRWDETNLNINKYQFAKDAYDAKKFAFVSDVLRTDILYEHGGIYLDIDVELLKPIDDLLDFDTFGGFETSNLINPGLLWGTVPKNEDLKNILEIYKNTKFDETKTMELTICEFFTKYFEQYGLLRENKSQKIDNKVFLSSEYFSPIDVITNKKNITKNTYSIHWYNASWYTPKQKLKYKIKKIANVLSFGLFGKVLSKIRKK